MISVSYFMKEPNQDSITVQLVIEINKRKFIIIFRTRS